MTGVMEDVLVGSCAEGFEVVEVVLFVGPAVVSDPVAVVSAEGKTEDEGASSVLGYVF
jgi:hypothetical protein